MTRRIATAIFALLLACGGSQSTGNTALQVTTPADGEIVVAGTLQTIEWVKNNQPSVDIHLSLPDGSTSMIASSIPDSGSFSWQVPLLHTGISGGAALQVVPAGTSVVSRTVMAQPRQKIARTSAVGLAMGSLAALKWDATNSQEQYYWIDQITGATTVVGIVGDLQSLPWPEPAAVDNGTHRLFVIGFDAASTAKVYTLDTMTGALLNQASLPDGAPSAVIGAAGTLLGFRWNSSAATEEVVTIDPSSGTQSVIGTVGDLQFWQSQIAVDAAADRLYVFGLDAASTFKIYTLVASTGAFVSGVPVTEAGAPISNLSGIAVNSSGTVLAFGWNGTTEDFLSIDATTGAAAVLGTVGDLQTWSDISAINPSNDNFYVVGNNSAQASILYVMDGRTAGAVVGDRLLYQIGIADYPTAGLLVY